MGRAPVTRSTVPAFSAIHARREKGDFLDCYGVASRLTPRQAADIIVDFPGWARFLLAVRQFVTAPFGLDNARPDAVDKIGPFPVERDHGTELIAGFDDRHLDFRVSVMSDEGRVSLATWVHPHNIGGRIYLAAILPFHILIIRNALSRVGRRGH